MQVGWQGSGWGHLSDGWYMPESGWDLVWLFGLVRLGLSVVE